MKNRKSFLKGALCGALAMLLVAGLVSCGLKVNNGNSDITSKTEDKISELQNLIEKHYMGDVKEKNLEDGVYKGYINGLNDPYSVYYNKKETKELYESTGGEYSGIGAVMSQNTETGSLWSRYIRILRLRKQDLRRMISFIRLKEKKSQEKISLKL